jgi:hypothetical protein
LSRVWFTDRNLGKRFPEILVAAGLTVERHDQLFRPSGSDEEWLEHCGRHGRIAITHDERIRYTPNELAALIQHRVALIIPVGKVPFPELAQNFVNSLDRIEHFLAGRTPPFIGKLYRPSLKEVERNPAASGRVELWYPRP